jgi:hypothetical protein
MDILAAITREERKLEKQHHPLLYGRHFSARRITQSLRSRQLLSGCRGDVVDGVPRRPAAAQKQVPFKGSLQGHETDTPEGGPPPTALNVDGNTTGIATHVGQFSFSYQLTVTLADVTATGSAHLIAANGDSIYTTVAGSSEMTATPGVFSITEVNTITGGTGRFDGAQGSLLREQRISYDLGPG